MNHIRGEEIVSGNPEHCINLLQILQQISSASMMQEDDSDDQDPELEELRKQAKNAQLSSNGASPGKSANSSSPDAMGGKPESAGKMNLAGKGKDSKKVKGSQGGSSRGGAQANDLFGGLDGEDDAEDDDDKQQFLDNIDDFIDINDINMENAEDLGQKRVNDRGQKRMNDINVRADKVGDVLGQELDIEFDDDI